MIFIGDVAHPFEVPPSWSAMRFPWARQPVVANLEGAFTSDRCLLTEPVLFNHPSILDALAALDVRAVSLANNHITDVPGGLHETLAALRSHGIASTGAGATRAEALAPAEFSDGTSRCLVFGFGWETIQCVAAERGRAGVAPLRPGLVLSTVAAARHRAPSSTIVVVVHWNYEMEMYPHPAHRQLAMAAINAGASAVIGHHPHLVGGIEFYRGAPIAYSLGNWWLPQGVSFGGKLRYPEDAQLQLAFEWAPGAGARCHWYRYDPATHALTHVKSEAPTESPLVQERTRFAGMPRCEYEGWFVANRKKRRMLPVYRDYRQSVRNVMRDEFVHLRHQGLMLLERSKLRSMLRV